MYSVILELEELARPLVSPAELTALPPPARPLSPPPESPESVEAPPLLSPVSPDKGDV